MNHGTKWMKPPATGWSDNSAIGNYRRGDLSGRFLVGCVVDNNSHPVLCKPSRNQSADAFRGSRHDRDLPVCGDMIISPACPAAKFIDLSDINNPARFDITVRV